MAGCCKTYSFFAVIAAALISGCAASALAQTEFRDPAVRTAPDLEIKNAGKQLFGGEKCTPNDLKIIKNYEKTLEAANYKDSYEKNRPSRESMERMRTPEFIRGISMLYLKCFEQIDFKNPQFSNLFEESGFYELLETGDPRKVPAEKHRKK